MIANPVTRIEAKRTSRGRIKYFIIVRNIKLAAAGLRFRPGLITDRGLTAQGRRRNSPVQVKFSQCARASCG